MRVNPSNDFPEDVREIRPYYCNDREKRGDEFFRRLCNSADFCVGLMDRAEPSLRRAPAAALAARAEIEAWPLIGEA